MDNYHKQDLKDFLHRVLSPTVLVLPTGDAEKVARKNELSFIDLLRPCSLVDTSPIAVHTTRDQPWRVPRMNIRFVESGEVEQAPEEFVDVVLDGVIASSASTAQGLIPEIKSKESAALVTQDKTERDLAPWFVDYREELQRGLRCSDHEYFDHPIAAILVVSSQEVDVISKLMALMSIDALPALFREGLMDPNMLKHYVLLHDNQEDGGARERAEESLRLMKETLGAPSCSLLCINSNEKGAAGPSDDIWTCHRPHAAKMDIPPLEENRRRGAFLSPADCDAITRFVSEFVTKSLVPHMDKRVRMLNNQVTAVRKGIKNQFKSWGSSLFGKPSGEAGREGFIEGSEASGPIYLYTSTEGQIRALADLAFMLHDYDLALSHYKLVQGDFKRDKAWRHVAGASEMSAICHFMMSPDTKKHVQDEYLDNAFINYQRFGRVRHSLRLSFLHADILRARGKFVEAAEKLIRITATDNNDLRSAILYEQAALSFLQVRGGGGAQVRKYALHLVHAGHRYLKGGHKAHGLRCYLAALQVYETRNWTHIDDHLYSALAKHSIAMHMLPQAVSFYVKLLGNQEGKPAERQLIYLRDFALVMRQHCPQLVISDLRLPLIKDTGLSICRSEPNADEEAVSANLSKDCILTWSDLEEALVDARRWRERVRQSKSTLQNLRAALPEAAPRNKRCIVVDEETTFSLDLVNPLQIPLELNSFTLEYEFSSSSLPPPHQDVAVPKEVEWKEHEEESAMEIEQQDLTLEPSSRTRVSLHMKAKKEGWVRVKGVRWKLVGVVRCVHHFDLKGKRLNDSKARRMQREYQRDERLDMQCVPPMPRLQATVSGLPDTALYGEIVRCLLHVRNVGSRAACGLRLAVSHPAFFSRASGEAETVEYPQGYLSRKTNKHEEESVPLHPFDASWELEPPVLELCWGEKSVLEAGQAVAIPIWYRAHRPGAQNFKLLLHYTSTDSKSAMRYRLLRLEASQYVLPSLKTSVNLRSSASDMDRLTLALTVDCVLNSSSLSDNTPLSPMHEAAKGRSKAEASLKLLQVMCLSSRWRAMPLAQAGGTTQFSVAGGSKVVIYLQVTPSGDAEQKGMTNSSVSFTPDCKHMALSSSPLTGFFHYWEQRRFCLIHPLHDTRELQDDIGTRLVLLWSTSDSGRMGCVFLSCGEPESPARPDIDSLLYNHSDASLQKEHSFTRDGDKLARLAAHSLMEKQQLCPLQLRVEGPTDVTLEACGKPMVVPITILVSNSGWSQPLSISFEALAPSEAYGSTEGQAMVERSWDFEWGGCLRKSLKLQARERECVKLSVCVYRPGVYNLNRFRITFSQLQFPSQDFSASNFQHLLRVHAP